MNNFSLNDQEAKEKELRYLWRLYERLAGPTGSYEFAHGESDAARGLQQHGVDAIVKTRRGKKEAWEWYENKIVNSPKGERPPYTAFCIETLSCTLRGLEKDGWIYTCQSDKLTYAFEQRLSGLPLFFDTFILQDMPRFKKWFHGLNVTLYPIHTEDKENKTRSVLLPIQDVVKEFPETQRYFVFEGSVIPVTKRENISKNIMSLVPDLRRYVETKNNNVVAFPHNRAS